jgi:hypothetical protein
MRSDFEVAPRRNRLIMVFEWKYCGKERPKQINNGDSKKEKPKKPSVCKKR